MFKDYPDILTVEQLSEALGIGINTAYKLIRKRVIGSKRIGRKIIIPKLCLIEYVHTARYNVN